MRDSMYGIALAVAVALSPNLGVADEPVAQLGNESDDTRRQRAQEFSTQGVEVGNSLEEAKRQFGPVRQKTVKPVQNPFDPGQTDEVVTLVFSGLTVTFHCSRASGEAQTCQWFALEVTGASVKVQDGLGVGAGAKKVEALLGQADERSTDTARGDSTWTYLPWRSAPIPNEDTYFRFTLSNGRVKKITWRRGLD